MEMIGATIACPFFLAPALCMVDDDPDKANIISTLVFMSGIITIFQSTFGTRLDHQKYFICLTFIETIDILYKKKGYRLFRAAVFRI